MAQIPENPLLRLDNPRIEGRQPGKQKNITKQRIFTANQQRRGSANQRFARLGEVLDRGGDPLELRSDPSGLAPERLLVFELTGDVANFSRAAAKVPGLEFIGAEEIEADDDDKNPVLYLLIPDAAALRQMLSLWRDWLAGKGLPHGFAPWRVVFSQLRDLRPWGPRDRVTSEDLAVLAEEHADENGKVRLELELVFRARGEVAEATAIEALQNVGGKLISRSRVAGAGYHALFVEVPQAELVRVRARENAGLVAEESIFLIRPQSVSQLNLFEVQERIGVQTKPLPAGEPIAAIFDSVPIAGHPLLANRLSVDDIFNLESMSAGERFHGTAMASAIIHGDLNLPDEPALDRPLYFVNVMYAPGGRDLEERFPDKLPADLFNEAIVRLKRGPNATGSGVIVVNASLGDRNKSFAIHISGWARVLDYLAYQYGILFVVSAGNHFEDLKTDGIGTVEFEALTVTEKAKVALRASGNSVAERRILSPAESINSLTVGGLHGDRHPPGLLPASTFDIWANTGLCNVSSALGPGYGGATKPDILALGGRHHVRLAPTRTGHRLVPLDKGASTLGRIRVAVAPTPQDPNRTARTIGTSVAAALATRVAIRAHEVLEATYDKFDEISGGQRALLLKALIVHCAKWTEGRELIIEVLGPSGGKQHVKQKDNVRRYLGYGAIDGDLVLGCAADRATLWGVGSLLPGQGHRFFVPLPAAMLGKAQFHELATTVAWFAPPRIGSAQYRGVRLKLWIPDELGSLGVASSKKQPDVNQAHRGTVIHRRWTGEKAAVVTDGDNLELFLQREPDQIPEAIPYAVVTTLSMPGLNDIYAQVSAKLAIRPKVPVPA
jgi:hypothetical protein